MGRRQNFFGRGLVFSRRGHFCTFIRQSNCARVTIMTKVITYRERHVSFFSWPTVSQPSQKETRQHLDLPLRSV